MTYTSQEISRINSSRSARQGELYIQDNRLVWVGTYAKTLTLRSGNPALPVGASKDSTVAERTKPSDTQLVDGSAHIQPISVDILPLPTGGATEIKQDITNLNQYTQLELLNLMYEELIQINKTLKKIYQ